MAKTPQQMAAQAPKPKAETETPAEEQKTDTPAEQPKVEEPAKQPEPAQEELKQDAKAADPAEVAEYCAANGAASMAAGLIRDKATMAQVKDRVGVSAKIRERAKAARATGATIDPKFEETAIEKGMTLEAVTDALFTQLTAQQSPEIRGNRSAGTLTPAGEAADKAAIDSSAIYASRKKATGKK